MIFQEPKKKQEIVIADIYKFAGGNEHLSGVEEALKILAIDRKTGEFSLAKNKELKDIHKPKKEVFQSIINSLYLYQQKKEERQELSNLYFQLEKAGLEKNRSIRSIQGKAATQKEKELSKIEEKDLSWENVNKVGGLPTVSTYKLEADEYKVQEMPRKPDVEVETPLYIDAKMLKHFCGDVVKNVRPERVENKAAIYEQKVYDYILQKGVSREEAQKQIELEEMSNSSKYKEYEITSINIEAIETVLRTPIPQEMTEDLSGKESQKLQGDRISAGIKLKYLKESAEKSLKEQRKIENIDKLLDDIKGITTPAMNQKQKDKLIKKVNKERQKAIKRLDKMQKLAEKLRGSKEVARYFDNIEDCKEFAKAKQRLNTQIFEKNQDYNNAIEEGKVEEGSTYSTKIRTESEIAADNAIMTAFWYKEIAYVKDGKSVLQLAESNQQKQDNKRNEFTEGLKFDVETQTKEQDLDNTNQNTRENDEKNEQDGFELGD